MATHFEARSPLGAILMEHSDAVLEIVAKRHGSNLRICGSVACGEDTPSSDFDFLVEFDTPVTLFTESGLERELEEELNVKVELSQPSELRAFVRAAALKDALLVWAPKTSNGSMK